MAGRRQASPRTAPSAPSPRWAGPPPRGCDIAVVGAGIVGLATARELHRRHPDARIAILKRADRPAAHQTGHSSGVVHAGIYYAPGSLKARLCVAGAREVHAYCEQRGIPIRRSGKLIVAVAAEELDRLAELERRGRANGVEGLRRLGGDELREVEPHARGVAALHSPATGVVDFAAVARALAGELSAPAASDRSGRVTIHLGCGVGGLRAAGGAIEIAHDHGTTRASAAALCAGGWADRLAVAAGAPAEPRIVPFRGAFARLRGPGADLVRASIYPVPDPRLPFLGVHLTRGIDGSVHAGPSALLVGARDAYRPTRVRAADLAETLTWPGTWRLLRRHWREALAEARRAASLRLLARELRRYVPALGRADLVAGFAGIRAQALARDGTLVDDFVVSRTERAVHVRNAPSPAATSALALARLVADQVDAELGR